MPTQLYVANLSYTVTNSDLERLFAVYGAVHDARVMSYPDSGQSTGSAIVDMGCEEAGDRRARRSGISRAAPRRRGPRRRVCGVRSGRQRR
jgi:hypothetical protein